jgi:hypothetical protein
MATSLRGRREQTEGWDVEEEQESIGHGIRTSAPLSHESRGERGGMREMGTSSVLSASKEAAA